MGVFHLDIESCTMCLLLQVLPHYLHNRLQLVQYCFKICLIFFKVVPLCGKFTKSPTYLQNTNNWPIIAQPKPLGLAADWCKLYKPNGWFETPCIIARHSSYTGMSGPLFSFNNWLGNLEPIHYYLLLLVKVGTIFSFSCHSLSASTGYNQPHRNTFVFPIHGALGRIVSVELSRSLVLFVSDGTRARCFYGCGNVDT